MELRKPHAPGGTLGQTSIPAAVPCPTRRAVRAVLDDVAVRRLVPEAGKRMAADDRGPVARASSRPVAYCG